MINNTILPIMKRMYVKLGGNVADIEQCMRVAFIIKKIFVLLGGDMTTVESYDTIAPILDKMVDVITLREDNGISLDTVNVFIGDYNDNTSQTVNYGVIDKYGRILVS